MEDCTEALNEFMRTGRNVLRMIDYQNINIVQINGQRKIDGPPEGWSGPPPPSDCELFVGKLPRNILEDTIYNFFKSCGKIYELRLMMDFSGYNRGYCFVKYTNLQDAERAIQKLNNAEIIPGNRIGVCKSLNNCRLCIDKLPRQIESRVVMEKIFSVTDEVEKVSVYRDIETNEARLALLHYKSHRGAAMARRRLVPERMNLFDGWPTVVNVDWAHPAMKPYNFIEETGSLDGNQKLVIKRMQIGNTGRPHFFYRNNRSEILDQRIEKYIEGNSLDLTNTALRSDQNRNIKSLKNINHSLFNSTLKQKNHNFKLNSGQSKQPGENVKIVSPSENKLNRQLTEFSGKTMTIDQKFPTFIFSQSEIGTFGPSPKCKNIFQNGFHAYCLYPDFITNRKPSSPDPWYLEQQISSSVSDYNRYRMNYCPITVYGNLRKDNPHEKIRNVSLNCELGLNGAFKSGKQFSNTPRGEFDGKNYQMISKIYNDNSN